MARHFVRYRRLMDLWGERFDGRFIELSYEGVAEALAIPVGTAKTRMRRALQQLRTTLGVNVTKESLR